MAHSIKAPVVTFSHEALHTPVTLEHMPNDSALPTPGDEAADGTNLRLWPTSLVLSQFLCEHPEYVAGKRVVELGSGSGAVGLVCAALGASSVTLTDVPDALGLISRNVERNPPPPGVTVSVAPCLWGDADHRDALLSESPSGYDVVLCCECVYQQAAEVLVALAQTQRALARGADAKVLLAYEFRSGLTEDIEYFDAATRLFGESTSHQLNSGEVRAFMDGRDDDGNDDRFLYVYAMRPSGSGDEPDAVSNMSGSA